MIRILLALGLLFATAASAQLLHGVTDSLSGGGTPIPPSCSNSLDFTQACNSQYAGAVL